MSTLSQFFLSRPKETDFAPGNALSFVGGINICYQGTGVLWVVSPFHSQVSRTWLCREDANIKAQAVTGCTTWFIPTVAQLQNPGYTCRDYWDSFTSALYWSSAEHNATCACTVDFSFGNAGFSGKTSARCVRAFRCVTY